MNDELQQFRDEWLSPREGTIGPHPIEGWQIEIPLDPFPGVLEEEPMVETSIRLDLVDLGVEDVDKVEGRTFTFPVNPEPGYIDGSVYVSFAHNPVDVTEIRFGSWEGERIEATFRMRMLFEFEGAGFQDRDAVLRQRFAAPNARWPRNRRRRCRDASATTGERLIFVRCVRGDSTEELDHRREDELGVFGLRVMPGSRHQHYLGVQPLGDKARLRGWVGKVGIALAHHHQRRSTHLAQPRFRRSVRCVRGGDEGAPVPRAPQAFPDAGAMLVEVGRRPAGIELRVVSVPRGRAPRAH